MKSQPLVSIVMPVFNGARYLRESLESVRQQSYKHWELILVDDGSTDETESIAQVFEENLVYVYQDNQGTAVARNHGIQVANGELLGFIDADDLWTPEKLKLQVDAIKDDDSLEMVSGMVQQFISPELSGLEKEKIFCPLDPQPGYSPLALLIHKRALEHVGLFAESLQKTDALDWVARIKQNDLPYLMLPDVVAKRRLHLFNKGRGGQDQRRVEILNLVKDAISQKRKPADKTN